MDLVIVGSVGIDTVETPRTRRERILGGSATYACASASFIAQCGMVGIVGEDFSEDHIGQLNRFGIDLAGLQRVPGKTFHWEGVYEQNMDNRHTKVTELNVFANFSPELPPAYRSAPYVFLANIAPALQLHVLDQVESPKFIMADTMDLWIKIAREDLLRVVARVDLLTLNESEARLLTGEHNLAAAAPRLLALGPKYLIIKKGEHGSMLFSKDGIFLLPAYPVADVQDPTGAGDTFAGGLMGKLAALDRCDPAALSQGMLYGSTLSSFGVEDFSLDRLAGLTPGAIEARAGEYAGMIALQPV